MIRPKSSKYTYEEVCNIFEYYGYKVIDNDYVSSISKVSYCDKDGYKYATSLEHFKRIMREGKKPYFIDARHNPYSVDNINLFIRKNGYNSHISSNFEYKSVKEPLDIVCSCGRHYSVTFNHMKNNNLYQCSYCKRKSMSTYERMVFNFLEENNVVFEYQRRERTLFKLDESTYIDAIFDFYIPQINTYIEVNGEQHYSPRNFGGIDDDEALDRYLFCTRRDKIKRLHCNLYGYNLITIPYTAFKDNSFLNILINSLL